MPERDSQLESHCEQRKDTYKALAVPKPPHPRLPPMHFSQIAAR